MESVANRTRRFCPLLVAGWAVAGFLPSVAAAQDVTLSGSASLDYQSALRSENRDTLLQTLNPEIALKVDVSVHDVLSFTGKICYGCHGLEIASARTDIELHQAANFQVGRMPIPFGEFTTRYDAANHRTASKPLPYMMGHMVRYRATEFNLGVLPIPYVDNAVVFHGSVWPYDFLQISYAAYVATGLKGDNDLDFQRQRSAFYTDNNRDLARGGRLLVTLSDVPAFPPWFLDFSLGASIMNGAYDDSGALHYLIYGADLTVRLAMLTGRGEFVTRRTDLDPNASGYAVELVDPFFTKVGYYVEVEHGLFEYLELSYRFDGLIRLGAPLPGSDLSRTDSAILRYSQGLNVIPVDALKIKLAFEYWSFNEFMDARVLHAAVVGSF